MQDPVTAPFNHVLIIEDDQFACERIKLMLGKIWGNSLILSCTNSVDEAHDLIKRGEFDLFIIDYLLDKGRTGLELLSTIRAKQVDVPVIMLTGVEEKGRDLALLQAGASDYLKKEGLSLAELERSLRFARERQRFSQERQQLLQEHQTLSTTVKSLEQVISIVGHELRTPLAGIRILLESELALNAGAGAIRDTLTEVVRLSQVVNNILDVTFLTAGKVNWIWEPFCLRESCRQALPTLHPLAAKAGVELIIDFPDNEYRLIGDGAALTRVVHNLVSNAIKHTRQGSITLALIQTAEQVMISVRDTGSGIPRRVLENLGKGFRLNASCLGETYISGSGFGLSIVRGIVGAHWGTITVSSEMGVGTEFVIRLPKAQYSPSSEQAPIVIGERGGSPIRHLDDEKALVLLDGDRELLEKLRHIFFETGFAVCKDIEIAANNGDLLEMRRLSHSVKSSAAVIGAISLAEVAREVEFAVVEDRRPDIPAAIKLLLETFQSALSSMATPTPTEEQ